MPYYKYLNIFEAGRLVTEIRPGKDNIPCQQFNDLLIFATRHFSENPSALVQINKNKIVFQIKNKAKEFMYIYRTSLNK